MFSALKPLMLFSVVVRSTLNWALRQQPLSSQSTRRGEESAARSAPELMLVVL